jgi:hypothetical protein
MRVAGLKFESCSLQRQIGSVADPSPDSSGNPLVPFPRLREAQKIVTDSGKKLQKNNIKPKNPPHYLIAIL